MNKLEQAIEWAKREVAVTGTGEYCAISPDDLKELIAAAEQVERAKFGSTELIEAGDKAHENTSGDVDSYFDFTRGFNEGAVWVLQRMKGENQ